MARACFGKMSWMHRICFSCCLETKRNQLSLLGLLPAVPTAIPKESRRTTHMDPTARATIRARQTARLADHRFGADPGAGIPPRLLRLSPQQICDRCRAPKLVSVVG